MPYQAFPDPVGHTPVARDPVAGDPVARDPVVRDLVAGKGVDFGAAVLAVPVAVDSVQISALALAASDAGVMWVSGLR
jgi:hypothetical protein